MRNGGHVNALYYCMLLPGPEAQQLAIYIGWLMNRTIGGLIAGTLFVLPGFLAIMALSVLYALYGGVGPVSALFFGLKSAVLVVVIQAVVRVGGRALRNRPQITIAAAAFVGLFLLHIPFPFIILAAGVIGFAGQRLGLRAFDGGSGGHGPKVKNEVLDSESVLGEGTPAHARPNLAWSLKVSGALLMLWITPVALLAVTLGWQNVFTQIAVFFSQMAVVTFGGAYAVLSYVAQEAVHTYGWLKPGEMLDGLGLAETTPGPLIMVTQFVGFMGALRYAEGMSPLTAGVLGGMLTTWVTFVPCFLWIFLGAPFVEALRGARALNAALTAITAAVVGVILNLAVWFALHVLFTQVTSVRAGILTIDMPVLGSLNLPATVLMLGAAFAAFRFKVGVLPLLLVCSAVGVAWFMLTGTVPGDA